MPPRRSINASSSRAAAPGGDWYLLHARMRQIEDPEVWRQLLVPPAITTSELRYLLTAAFGWAGTHLAIWSVREISKIYSYSPAVVSDLNPEGYHFPKVGVGFADLAREIYGNRTMFSDDDDYGLPEEMTLAEVDAKFQLGELKHILQWEYDMGDGWEHVIMIEKRIPEAEVLASPVVAALATGAQKRTAGGTEKTARKPRITAGFGHCVAEDAGSTPGWQDIKEAYKVQGTNKDTKGAEGKRKWYESSCSNGDPKGLKGKERLEFFDIKEANLEWEYWFRHGEQRMDGDYDDEYD